MKEEAWNWSLEDWSVISGTSEELGTLLAGGGDCPAPPDASPDRFEHGLAEAGGAVGHHDPGRAHRLDLVVGAALAARDDGAGVAHAAARRRGAPGDEAGNRLLAALLGLVLEELRGVLFRRAADLADHDDALGLVIGEEPFQHVDMLGPLDRVAADTHACGLPEPHIGGLLDRLVGEGARTRDHAAGA